MATTIYLGADHAGYDLKNIIAEHLELRGYGAEDLGAHSLDPQDDYPHFAALVSKAVLAHPGSLGILICGSAEGVCIAANKFHGIRAGIGYSNKAAQALRNDDDANILCLPGRVELEDDVLQIVELFLTTPYKKEARHERRLSQITTIEEKAL